MIKPLRMPRMGLLLLSPERFSTLGEGTARGSYRERKEAEAARMQADCAAMAEVTFPGIVWNTEDVKRAMDAFTQAKVDFVLAIYLSWAEDFAWIRFLRDMPPVPVLFAHCMRDEINLRDTHDDDEFTEYLCCGGLVGAQEASGDNVNYARPMLETAVGTWAQILTRARVFGNAARARAILRDSRVGLLACYNEAMWSTYVHPYDLFRKVGPELKFLSVAELADYVEGVPELEARAVAAEIAARYEVRPDVEQGKFVASVRASMAMERMAEAYSLDLLVLNDIDTVLFPEDWPSPGFLPDAALRGCGHRTGRRPRRGNRNLYAAPADRRPCEFHRAFPYRSPETKLCRRSRGAERLHRPRRKNADRARRAFCQIEMEICGRALCVACVPGRSKDHAALLAA